MSEGSYRGPKTHPKSWNRTKHRVYTNFFVYFREVRANFSLLPCETSQEPNGNCSEKNLFRWSFIFWVDFLEWMLLLWSYTRVRGFPVALHFSCYTCCSRFPGSLFMKRSDIALNPRKGTCRTGRVSTAGVSHVKLPLTRCWATGECSSYTCKCDAALCNQGFQMCPDLFRFSLVSSFRLVFWTYQGNPPLCSSWLFLGVTHGAFLWNGIALLTQSFWASSSDHWQQMLLYKAILNKQK